MQLLMVQISFAFHRPILSQIKYFMAYQATSGQSYKASTIVIYASRVVPDLKIPHITTLEL